MDQAARIRRLESQIERLKTELVTDDLTKILNRRGLIEALAIMHKEVSFSLANPQKRRNINIKALSVIFIDIDHFKKVNTDYGHDGGDKALMAVASTIKKRLRGIDIVGRYGGEEIVVGLVGADLADAAMIAEDIRKSIEQLSIDWAGKKLQLTVSLGVAMLKIGQSLEDLIAQADQALYKAKHTGRNQVITAA